LKSFSVSPFRSDQGAGFPARVDIEGALTETSIFRGREIPLMPRYRPGDHVIYHFRRPDLLKLQFRTGLSLPPFKVMRVLPGEDGEPAYQVQWPLEPYARIVREHELAPAG
jgi:hypothetical protein